MARNSKDIAAAITAVNNIVSNQSDTLDTIIQALLNKVRGSDRDIERIIDLCCPEFKGTLDSRLAQALTDTPTEQMWSGERTTADGAPIKDGVAFVSTLKGKTMKVNQMFDISTLPEQKTVNGITFRKEGNTIFASGTCTAKYGILEFNIVNIDPSHKYLINTSGSHFKAYKLVIFNTQIQGKPEIVLNKTSPRSYIAYSTNDADIDDALCLNIIDLTDMFGAGNEPTTPDDFAQRFGYKSIEDMPYIPYTPTTNLQSFAPKAIVSKKDGVELGRLPFDLTTIVDASGNQLFPDGELRSAGSVCDEVDYANGVAVRGKKVIGRVNLGELAWSSHNADRRIFRTSEVPFKMPSSITTAINVQIVKYRAVSNSASWVNGDISNSGSLLTICDTDYATPADFKSAMQGVYLEFELATPIEGEAPITKSFYPVQSNGTEEAITDNIVPMNAEIRYRYDNTPKITSLEPEIEI